MFDLGVFLELFSTDIYKSMLDKDEMWFVTSNGFATPIMDASLMDC